MPRMPQVTRTITTTEATVKCYHADTKTITSDTVILPKKYKDNDAIKATAQKLYKHTNIIVLDVESASEKTELYGMSEEDFVKHAKILPPRMATNDTEEDE